MSKRWTAPVPRPADQTGYLGVPRPIRVVIAVSQSGERSLCEALGIHVPGSAPSDRRRHNTIREVHGRCSGRTKSIPAESAHQSLTG